MKNYSECFKVVKKDCFKFISSQETHAEKFIDLGPSLKLSYKTGNIDTTTFNGFASDISFFDKFNNDELIGNAKTLKIESKKNYYKLNFFFMFSAKTSSFIIYILGKVIGNRGKL